MYNSVDMSVFSRERRTFLEAVNRVAAANPFLPELGEAERDALGTEYQDQGAVWSLAVEDPQRLRSNAWRICDRLERELPAIRAKIQNGRASVREEDAALFEGAVVYMLYHRFYPRIVEESFARGGSGKRKRSPEGNKEIQ